MEKTLHGQFKKAIDEGMGRKSWDWLKNGYLNREIESAVDTAQDEAFSTNSIRTTVFAKYVFNMLSE